MAIKYQMNDVGFQAVGLNHGELQIVTKLDEEYGLGFASSQLMLSALAGCSGLTLKQVLKKKRKSYEDITITADMQRNEEKRKRIEVVTLNFVIKSNDIDEELKGKLGELVLNNCPMIQSVIGKIDVREVFEVQPATVASAA